MKIPLIVLATLSLAGGFIGIPEFLLGEGAKAEPLNFLVAGMSVAAALAGITAGTLLYAGKKLQKDPLPQAFGGFYGFLVNKFYLDDLFVRLAGLFQFTLAKLFFWFDWNVVIQKGVNGVGSSTRRAGSFLRRAETGVVQTYAMVFAFGVVAVVYFMLMKG